MCSSDLLLGLAGLSYASEPAWLIHLLGILFLIGRVVFAWALSQPGPLGYMPGRVFGMALTWGPLIVAGVLLVVVAVARVR